MKRLLKWTGGILAAVAGLLVFLIIAVFVLANIGPGQRLIEQAAKYFTQGDVVLIGLSGRFPDALRLKRLELHDTKGIWLTIDDLSLDWTPTRLFSKTIEINRIEAANAEMARLPAPSGAPPPPTQQKTSFASPLPVEIQRLVIGRFDLGAPVAGTRAVLAAHGSAHFVSLEDASLDLALQRLDGGGDYALAAKIDPNAITGHVTAKEPEHGLISSFAQLPGLGAISLDAAVEGPRAAERLQLTLQAGELQAAANGTVDLENYAADLTLTAHAPAMRPSAEIAWQRIALDAHLQGPFTRPHVTGQLRAQGLEAAGGTIESIIADVHGDAGQVDLAASFNRIQIAGPNPNLLAGAPLTLQAQAQLEQPRRPITFHLAHPLIDAQGAAQTAPSIQGQMAINLPDLAPFAALARIDLRGQSKLNARADVGNEVALAVEGTLGVTGGMAPIPGLIGDAAKLKVAATLHGQDITLSEFSVDGKTLQASANGSVAQGRLAADWKLALSDLAVVAPNLGGNLSMHGTAQGVPDDVSAVVDLSGRIAAAHIPPGPVQAHIEAQHLPGGIDAKVAAQGELDRDPLTLRAAVNQKPDGLALTIDQASWKSLDARGAVTLPKGAFVPIGNLDFRMTRLEDLRPFVNQPITGSINGAIESTANQARMTLDVRDAGLPQARVARAKLDATVANPVDHPTLDGRLVVSNFSAGGIGGDATLEARGPQDALGLRLTAGVRNLQGADAQMQAQSVLNLPGKEVSISSLEASWKGESLRLLSPARVAFGDGIVVDRLRAGIGQAVLDVAGRASPALDFTVSLRNVTPELAAPFVPGLQADGRISAEAKLKGAPAQLSGTARIEAAGLKMRTGPGRALPPADLRISADLRAGTARIDGRLIAGRVTNFTLTGTAPVMRQGALDLRAGGRIDLAMLNPLLAANGQRISGQVALNTTITGAPNAPRVGGTVQLANGEVEDYAHGARLGDMAALIRAEGDTIRIVRFTARAGKGTIEASGTVGILAARLPVDISLTARNATPVASDLITATLNADLSLRGQAREHLEAAGRIVIVRAEIHIPEKLPPSIQTLDVRRPGQKPPPPPSGPALEIALNLSFRADQIFVRGRGIDAELGGTVRVTGTANNPVPIGSFEMRRGQISVAGTTLRFTKGEVSFNGGSLADPSLDFTATSTTSSIIASLHVGGTASDPKITLSSTPELPQDEVLAHLLFGRSMDTLSPFQVASIALALAELTGVAPGVGDPLEQARRGLGLDVLRLGSGPGGNPNLEAGRYLAPGVFLGARQGTSSNSTQGTIQFDLAKGLKLDAFVGTGQASNISGAPPTESQGSGVGLTYQFEY